MQGYTFWKNYVLFLPRNLNRMKKVTLLRIPICWCFLLFSACNTSAPEKYFDLAMLKSAKVTGFAGDGMQKELENPATKEAEGNKKAMPMKRKEVIDDKIQFLEANMKELKSLKETRDSKDMLQASIALHQYVLPVYKTEYQQLAKLYDKDASKKEIQSLTQAIHDKYYLGFNELFNKLAIAAKAFANKHKIKVNWVR